MTAACDGAAARCSRAGPGMYLTGQVHADVCPLGEESGDNTTTKAATAAVLNVASVTVQRAAGRARGSWICKLPHNSCFIQGAAIEMGIVCVYNLSIKLFLLWLLILTS